MKEIFTKIRNSKFIKIFLQLFVLGLIYEFIVTPGLTLDNTLINIVSGLIGVGLLVYLFFLLELDTIIKKFKNK
jgi:hypothetical protein